MVAACVLVDLGGAAELAPDHHGDVALESAAVNVVDQRRDTLVEHRQVLAEPVEVAPVRIPESVRDCDATRPGLNQAAGDQELLV